MHPDSLCRLCVDPSKCPLCDVMRNPRPAPVGLARVLDLEADKRKAALSAEVARLKAERDQLLTRRSVGLHPMPAPTVPPAVPLAPLAPAPVPLGMTHAVFGPLKPNDWAGLAARVDAGCVSKADAERIGSEWMNAFQGVTARA